MRFPATSSALNCLMDPSRRNVQFNQSVYPALQVLSVLNKATGNSIIQNTSSLQPVWASNQIKGTYSARNNTGINVSGTPGVSGLLFSGAAYMEQDSVTNAFSKAEAPLTVTCVVNPATAGGTIWSFCDPTDAFYISLSYTGGNIVLKEVNANGTFSTTFAMTAGTVHVVTGVRSGNTLTLRVDGSVAGTAAVTAGTAIATTFLIGALKASGTISSQFNGSVGKLAVYSGSADVFAVETFLLLEAGIIRGPTSGLNSGF